MWRVSKRITFRFEAETARPLVKERTVSCRVRLSLGLKPLQIEKNEDKERAAHAAKVAAKAEEQRKIKEEEVAERIRA